MYYPGTTTYAADANLADWMGLRYHYSNLIDYITSEKPYENMGTIKAFEIADNQLNQIADIATDYNKNKKF